MSTLARDEFDDCAIRAREDRAPGRAFWLERANYYLDWYLSEAVVADEPLRSQTA